MSFVLGLEWSSSRKGSEVCSNWRLRDVIRCESNLSAVDYASLLRIEMYRALDFEMDTVILAHKTNELGHEERRCRSHNARDAENGRYGSNESRKPSDEV